MRAKREGARLVSGRRDDDGVEHRLSIRSTSTGSSLLSDNSRSEPLSSCSHSEPNRHPPLPVFSHITNISGGGYDSRDADLSTCFIDGEFTGAKFTQEVHSQPVIGEDFSSRGSDTTHLNAVFHEDRGCGVQQKIFSMGNESSACIDAKESPVWAELSYGSIKKNTTALNAVSVSSYFSV